MMATAAVTAIEIHNGKPTTASNATAGAYITMPICIVCNNTNVSFYAYTAKLIDWFKEKAM